MSSTAETVCPKCGATEIKSLSWGATLGAVLFFVNGVVQLVLGFVFFQGAQFWTQMNHASTNVLWGGWVLAGGNEILSEMALPKVQASLVTAFRQPRGRGR